MKGRKYIISSLFIEGYWPEIGSPLTDISKIGPFDTRKEAWEFGCKLISQYGNAGGAVETDELYSPEFLLGEL